MRILFVRTVVFVLAAVLADGALAEWPKPRPLDPQRLAAAGLRIVRSEHCTLVTDQIAGHAVDSLPRVLDAAVGQWGERFGVSEDRLEAWRIRAYFIGDRTRFDAMGLMPKNKDQFPHGYSQFQEVWFYDQPTDYYRRHLLLHEATHAFMMTELGGCGPAWFMEAMAELLGTHRQKIGAKSLQLASFPASRSEAPHWGRVRLVRAGTERSIASLMRLDNRTPMPVESYAWLWALAKFLDTHPRYQARWRALPEWVLHEDFDERFRATYRDDWEQLGQEWRLFTMTLTYGHDIEREAIDFESGTRLQDAPHMVQVVANRGWQPSGVWVEAGRRYHLAATGRCVIAQEADGTRWPSEGGGVTLTYHADRPLGELLATVDTGPDAFVRPTPIGLSTLYEPPTSGTLYLRLNDAPNRLAENNGEIRVTVRSSKAVD